MSNRLYRLLLRLLPFAFQREYGREMEDVFHQQSADSGARWGRTVRGITRTAISEHLELFLYDVRHGIRALRKNTGFTTVAVMMLAVEA